MPVYTEGDKWFINNVMEIADRKILTWMIYWQNGWIDKDKNIKYLD